MDIGIKYADKQERAFDEEKMKAGQCVIGLQVRNRFTRPDARNPTLSLTGPDGSTLLHSITTDTANHRLTNKPRSVTCTFAYTTTVCDSQFVHVKFDTCLQSYAPYRFSETVA